MIKAFIFDMDGTIVDNMAVHTAVWLEILADLGTPMTAAEFQASVAGKTNLETMRQLVDSQITAADAERISLMKEERYRQRYAPLMQPMPGLLSLLHQARQAGIKLAVATAAGTDNINFIMGGLQLWQQFDAVVGADDVERGKPFPDLFLLAAERLGVPPANCLVFEDALTGIEAARRAGMSVIAMTTAHTSSEVAHLPKVQQAIPDFTHVNLADF